MLHFASTSDGALLTMDPLTGIIVSVCVCVPVYVFMCVCLCLYVCMSLCVCHTKLMLHCYNAICIHIGQKLWQRSYSSPVVAIYSWEGSALREVPVTSVARQTMDIITGSTALAIKTASSALKASDSILQ